MNRHVFFCLPSTVYFSLEISSIYDAKRDTFAKIIRMIDDSFSIPQFKTRFKLRRSAAFSCN